MCAGSTVRVLATGLMLTVVLAQDPFWILPQISDYRTHPCKRDCLRSRPMICEYNFTIEHYQTLSRACYNCPNNISDCSRPHCVPADGFVRAIKVVNRMLPGPALHICQGDTVTVNVYNQLSDFEGTSIHWHGILQEGTPHMDGVAMVTQCPISAHSIFQYKFQAHNSGTHYWHAHAGMQRGDGIFGALVVRDTSYKSVMAHYDHDLPEHTVIVQDWLDQYSSSKFSLHHHSMRDNEPSSILINGRGTSYSHACEDAVDDGSHGGHDMSGMSDATGSMADHSGMSMTTEDMHAAHNMQTTTTNPNMGHDMSSPSSTADNLTTQSNVPHTVFRVTGGKGYRFRFISNGVLNCPLQVSIEQHRLIIIATDGNDIDPVIADSITIFAGERYDVVLKADQPVGNYWMYVRGLIDCQERNTSQTAIIRYDGAMKMQPKTSQIYPDGDSAVAHANPLTFTQNAITVANMTSPFPPDDIYTAHNVRKFYMRLGYNRVENYHFLDPEYYPLSVMYEGHTGDHMNHLFALQVNNITFKMPMSPVLSQFEDLSEEMFCNETSPPMRCESEFCECVHRIKVSVNDIVELVLISDGVHGPGNHPMHLHGHRFYVLGMDKLGASITRAEVEALDARGKLQRNLRNPIQKDTVLVPDGGYTIVRFRASNPGFWLFHCHVDFHFALGMSAVFQVGEVHEMTTTPTNFPRCGSWRFTQNSDEYSMCRKYLNSADQYIGSLLNILGLFICFKILS